MNKTIPSFSERGVPGLEFETATSDQVNNNKRFLSPVETGMSSCCMAVWPPVCACSVEPVVRMSCGAAAATGADPRICPAPLAPPLLVVPNAADGLMAARGRAEMESEPQVKLRDDTSTWSERATRPFTTQVPNQISSEALPTQRQISHKRSPGILLCTWKSCDVRLGVEAGAARQVPRHGEEDIGEAARRGRRRQVGGRD